MGTAATSINIAKTIIKEFEGLRLNPYLCPAGQQTIGYGHVMQKDDGLCNRAANNKTRLSSYSITKAKAEELLEQDIAKTKAAIHRHCIVPITIEQEAALISFTFNCGSGAFQASTLRQKLNRGEYELAANEFLRWVHAGGIKLAGLVRRRIAERNLFLIGT